MQRVNIFYFLTACKPMASLFTDSAKLCDCGLLEECRVPFNQYNSAMNKRCEEHLSKISEKKLANMDYCLRYYNVSQTLAEITWNSSANHNWTSFAALDACATVANNGQRTTKYTDIFTEYVVLHDSKTHQISESLQLRCKLLEISAGQTVGLYFAGLMQQWFEKYCM